MSNHIYNQNKLSYHPLKIIELREGKQTNPLHVQIVISDLCNQDCNFCAYRISNNINNELFKIIDNQGKVENNPNRMISNEKLDEILEDLVAMDVKAIQLTGGGEPSVHPYFENFCEKIIKKNIDLGIITNGLLLKNFDLLSQSSWLRVSLDAAKEETYAKIKKVSLNQFTKVKNNIKKLISFKNKCDVGIGFVITNDNYKEIFDVCFLAKDLGVNYIRLSAFFQNDTIKYYGDNINKILTMCEEVKKIENENFKIFNNFKNRLNDLRSGSPDYNFCTMMNVSTYIAADLNVYTCCNNAYSKMGLIGSISNQRFANLWKSEKKETFFKNFNPQQCQRCMFNEKNKNFIDLIEEPKNHKNFI